MTDDVYHAPAAGGPGSSVSAIRSAHAVQHKQQVPTAPRLPELRRLIELRLAWYGVRDVKLGPFVGLGDGSLFVALLNAAGKLVDRVEVDRVSGALRPTRPQAARITRYLISDQGLPAGSSEAPRHLGRASFA